MEAIIEAEKWFSEKITKDYFDKTNEIENVSFNEYKNSNRGLILSSAIFIEIIEKISHSKVKDYKSLTNKTIFKFMDMIEM